MRRGGHGAANEALITRVCGILAKHAEHPPVDYGAAVAELQAVTLEPHLLGHAWVWAPQYPVFADPWIDVKNEILSLAGADPQPRNGQLLC